MYACAGSLLAYLSAELVKQLVGQATKLLDQQHQQIGEPQQEPGCLLLESGWSANLARVTELRIAQLAMAVPTHDDSVASKRSPGDVMEFKAMRVGLGAKCTRGIVGA
jgi:hypothetical protein